MKSLGYYTLRYKETVLVAYRHGLFAEKWRLKTKMREIEKELSRLEIYD